VFRIVHHINESSGRVGGPTVMLDKRSYGKRGLSGYVNDPETKKVRPIIAPKNQEKVEQVSKEEQARRDAWEAGVKDRASVSPKDEEQRNTAISDLIHQLKDNYHKVLLSKDRTIKPSEYTAEMFPELRGITYLDKNGETGNTITKTLKLSQDQQPVSTLSQIVQQQKELYGTFGHYGHLTSVKQLPNRIANLKTKVGEVIKGMLEDVHPEDEESKKKLLRLKQALAAL
jgi:hypothetical protein